MSAKKTVIITGANSGIGFEVAKALCGEGNDVIMACRSEERGRTALAAIQKAQPDAIVDLMLLDLSDLDTVRKFVTDFEALNKPLDVLINNGGLLMGPGDRVVTKDNYELTMATNYLGPFLLTDLLLDNLKRRASDVGETRIVNVASGLHDREYMSRRGRGQPQAEIDLDDLFLAKPGAYTNRQAYKDSKLAMVMWTYQLAAKLEGSGVMVNALGPGFIPSTNLAQNYGPIRRFAFSYILAPILRLTGTALGIDEGKTRVMYVATSDETKGVTGKYYQDGKVSRSSEESYNEDKQRELWDISVRYCKVDGCEQGGDTSVG